MWAFWTCGQWFVMNILSFLYEYPIPVLVLFELENECSLGIGSTRAFDIGNRDGFAALLFSRVSFHRAALYPRNTNG